VDRVATFWNNFLENLKRERNNLVVSKKRVMLGRLESEIRAKKEDAGKTRKRHDKRQSTSISTEYG
jgi:hypothetical protein